MKIDKTFCVELALLTLESIPKTELYKMTRRAMFYKISSALIEDAPRRSREIIKSSDECLLVSNLVAQSHDVDFYKYRLWQTRRYRQSGESIGLIEEVRPYLDRQSGRGILRVINPEFNKAPIQFIFWQRDNSEAATWEYSIARGDMSVHCKFDTDSYDWEIAYRRKQSDT